MASVALDSARQAVEDMQPLVSSVARCDALQANLSQLLDPETLQMVAAADPVLEAGREAARSAIDALQTNLRGLQEILGAQQPPELAGALRALAACEDVPCAAVRILATAHWWPSPQLPAARQQLVEVLHEACRALMNSLPDKELEARRPQHWWADALMEEVTADLQTADIELQRVRDPGVAETLAQRYSECNSRVQSLVETLAAEATLLATHAAAAESVQVLRDRANELMTTASGLRTSFSSVTEAYEALQAATSEAVAFDALPAAADYHDVARKLQADVQQLRTDISAASVQTGSGGCMFNPHNYDEFLVQWQVATNGGFSDFLASHMQPQQPTRRGRPRRTTRRRY